MRALRFHRARELCVEKVPEPGPPGPGEVLLRPVMCGICGTDLHEYTDGPIVTPARAAPADRRRAAADHGPRVRRPGRRRR